MKFIKKYLLIWKFLYKTNSLNNIFKNFQLMKIFLRYFFIKISKINITKRWFTD